MRSPQQQKSLRELRNLQHLKPETVHIEVKKCNKNLIIVENANFPKTYVYFVSFSGIFFYLFIC